jgi:hypothetical protein
MKTPDIRGLLYFAITVLSVWSGELSNLGGPALFQRMADRWPALLLSSLLAGLVAVRAYLDQHLSRGKDDAEPTTTETTKPTNTTP